MSWTNQDLQKLKDKGFTTIDDFKTKEVKIEKPKKVSVEKNTIELYLRQLTQSRLIDDFILEYQFTSQRKFRFDYFIPCLNLAIEYEGIMSEKSGHTTIKGYTSDLEKYNLALILGYKVLRYNALNYKNSYTDIEKLINSTKK